MKRQIGTNFQMTPEHSYSTNPRIGKKIIKLKPVKLVIWDLDDTFWRGTLSEESIEYSPQHHDIIIELSRRGIVNSICSKNSYQPVRKLLQSHAIWDYFVMPYIDWQPKGPAIKNLIDDMNLRAENVLFIDDNHLNLAEARFYSPKLQVAHPTFIPELLGHDALRGNPDTNLSRLKQYKTLEKKLSDRISMGGSNEEFLRNCQIIVTIHANCSSQVDRILELNTRTNQLNFTKERLNRDGLLKLINAQDCETKYLSVTDKYGEYGICGFYARRGNRLLQFLFSCRILGMGVEQWLYNKLGCPKLVIKGDTATTLEKGFIADWIRESDSVAKGAFNKTVCLNQSVFIKGGCDLEQLAGYLNDSLKVTTEFNYQSNNGIPIHTEHTEIIRRCESHIIDQYGYVIDKLPFLDRNAYRTKFFNAEHDVYVYSALMDYSNGLYRYRQTDWIIPFGDFLLDITCKKNWDYLIHNFSDRGLNRNFLVWFAAEFQFIGKLTPEKFKTNLRWLFDRLPPQSFFIVMNGSEIPKTHQIETDRWLHHRKYNQILEQFSSQYDRIAVCDVRRFVRSAADITDNIRHYHRRNYFLIAKEIEKLITARLDLSPSMAQSIPAGLRYHLVKVRKSLNKIIWDKMNIRKASKIIFGPK